MFVSQVRDLAFLDSERYTAINCYTEYKLELRSVLSLSHRCSVIETDHQFYVEHRADESLCHVSHLTMAYLLTWKLHFL